MAKKKGTSFSDDSFEAHRERQRIAEEEELKAKLALVKMESRPTYGRAPKKIGQIVASTRIKNGYRDHTVSFVLRLDGADFIAEHGDVWYRSKSREALEAKMREVAKVAVDVQWTRYIEIDYTAEADPDGSSWRSYSDTLRLDDSRGTKKKPRSIFGFSLKWKLVDYSQAIRLPGDDEDRFMKRDVDEDGKPSTEQETTPKLPRGLVPHTPEREAFLRSVYDAISAIDGKLVELLRGDPDEVAAKLDATSGPMLLAAPKK